MVASGSVPLLAHSGIVPAYSDFKLYFDQLCYLELCVSAYGILSELYFDINYDITMNNI